MAALKGNCVKFGFAVLDVCCKISAICCTGDCRMFATGLEMHQIVEVTNANFLALLFKSGPLLIMRSKHCGYSVVTMSI